MGLFNDTRDEVLEKNNAIVNDRIHKIISETRTIAKNTNWYSIPEYDIDYDNHLPTTLRLFIVLVISSDTYNPIAFFRWKVTKNSVHSHYIHGNNRNNGLKELALFGYSSSIKTITSLSNQSFIKILPARYKFELQIKVHDNDIYLNRSGENSDKNNNDTHAFFTSSISLENIHANNISINHKRTVTIKNF